LFPSRLLIALTTALAATVAGAPAWARQVSPAPVPAPVVTVLEPAAIRADFTALYEGLQQATYDLYAHTPKPVLDRLYDETLNGFDQSVSLDEIRTRFQLFVAEARLGHARIEVPAAEYAAFRAAGGKAFPLMLRIVAGRSYVGTDYSGLGTVDLGDEILSLDGVPMADWLERTGRHLSTDNDYMAHSLLEFMFPQLIWLERGEVERFELVVRKADGREQALTLPARSRPEALAAAGAQPETLELDGSSRSADMLDHGVAYLRPGPSYNVEPGANPWDPAAFHTFIDAAFARFMADSATDLLIDLRVNPGGDNSFSDHMVAWFADRPFRFASDFRIRISPQSIASNAERVAAEPVGTEGASSQLAALYADVEPGGIVHFAFPESAPRDGPRFEGRVWVLVNRQTYSNAVSTAALIQDYGFGTILGEPTSDLATSYGAMEHFTLPATGLRVGYPKAHIIRPSGDEEARGVTPDILIETPVIQSAADPVLQQALAILRSRP
tara:strand:+ start:1770 stop:3266 length:1497 start_codon:yes stop_codon:yes gene_type:complete